MTDFQYRSAEELLPEDLLSSLSMGAKRLYTKVWNLMAKQGKDILWLSDRVATFCTRLNMDLLQRCTVELVDARLLTIKPGHWPAEDPPNICHCYKFIDDTIRST